MDSGSNAAAFQGMSSASFPVEVLISSKVTFLLKSLRVFELVVIAPL